METENKLQLGDVFVGIADPRQRKVDHDLLELLVVAVCSVLVGADTFVEIEHWAEDNLEWFKRHLKLENGIPSHDTFGRVFAAMDAAAFSAAFQRWVQQIVPSLTKGEVVAIDGKTSRRSGAVGKTPLHLVSAFAAGAQLILGQRATAEKSNEKTAIPELLATLALEGCIVTIDAMGTQPNIAQAIRDGGADYILSVKDNQPTLADSMRDFFDAFQAAPNKTPHQFDEVVKKNHGRLEVRRYYITSLLPDAAQLNHAVRQHWSVETSLHWYMDVVFADDQISARVASRSNAFVLHLPSPTKRNSSVFYKIRAIALKVPVSF